MKTCHMSIFVLAFEERSIYNEFTLLHPTQLIFIKYNEKKIYFKYF